MRGSGIAASRALRGFVGIDTQATPKGRMIRKDHDR